MAPFHVCIVDDADFDRAIAVAALEDAGFALSECATGDACLDLFATAAAAGQAPPDLVLLDIEMPGMDGYATCRRLRETGPDGLQVMFVSAHNDLASRLASFDAGGDDFIAKPVDAAELQRKVAIALRTRQQLATLAQDKSAAEEMSTVVLDTLDEMGAVQKFLRHALGCRTFAELGQAIIDALAGQGCHGIVQLRGATDSLTLSPRGPATPLEQSILDQSQQLERVFQFRSRMIVNFDHVSIFVTNMPLDEARAGRLRDQAATIGEAADAAAANISLNLDVVARACQMQALARSSRDSVTTLREEYRRQQTRTHEELEQMADNIEGMYYKLGLSAHQEQVISDLVRDATDRVLQLFALGVVFETQFGDILARLEAASNIAVEAETKETVANEVWL